MDEVLSEFSPDEVWWDRFVLAVVELNPSRAILSVVATDRTTARDLFFVSFRCMYESCQNLVVGILPLFETILDLCQNVYVVETLLRLLEYMDLQQRPIPLGLTLVVCAAERVQNYAVALFFAEKIQPINTEQLIALNIKLGFNDCVYGLLRSVENVIKSVKPSWHEKLENWSAALNAYTVAELHDPDGVELVFGRLRCLLQLGEWHRLFSVAAEHGACSFQAAACFHTQRWETLAELLPNLAFDEFEHFIYAASVCVHGCDFNRARRWLEDAKSKFFQLSRNAKIRNLQIEQMSEIIEFASDVETCDVATRDVYRALNLQEKWAQRLRGLDYSVSIWKALVPMRALVFSPFDEDLEIWVKFSTLCRKKQSLSLSNRIVEALESDPKSAHMYSTTLSRIKNIYASGNVCEAAHRLDDFLHANASLQIPRYLHAKCYLALALWLPHNDMRVSSLLEKSLTLDPISYKSRSAFALLKFKQLVETSPMESVVEAVRALFACVVLTAAPQDVLRLITVWFRFYGIWPTVDVEFDSGFESVPLKAWIQVLPQIMARIRDDDQTKRMGLTESVAGLIKRIANAYPQSTIFPLTVAVSPLCKRILHSLNLPTLVHEANLVATQLVRISISWAERWTTILEEASRVFFVEKNLPKMVEILQTAHLEFFQHPHSVSEWTFVREFGDTLKTAKAWLDAHCRYVNESNAAENFYVETSWKYYYTVFQKLAKRPASKTVFLPDSSPELAGARDLTLWVPGVGRPVQIVQILNEVQILTSKQKPRIVWMIGSDGKTYKYLLKGNEDLKQDERVMQLFVLINSVVSESVMSQRRSGVFPSTVGIETLENIELRNFAVVPLSQNAGLIEWVPDCDTLHAIIKFRRECENVPLALEHNLMRSTYANYENLPVLQHVEIFEAALAQTTGNELASSMWFSSGGCERWVNRRISFSRSLAVTSIVGFVLGLGDRHPSNLMIERSSGKVIHIDFGDCFDVAAVRERFPEKIPFRLTRQLVNALEISSIEGTFRMTSERIMDLFQKNIDTILAMLEAFIHDPLVTWKLQSDARDIIDTVHGKLTSESIPAQIDALIHEATAHENLCQCYLGWCSFW